MKKILRFAKEWLSFFVFIGLMFIFRSAIADWYEVPTGSMKPTIVEGDRVFVNKLAYKLRIPFTLITISHWADPERGDVVVFDSPVEDKLLIKRVVGLPGDIIEIKHNQLFINNISAEYLETDQLRIAQYWDSIISSPVLYEEIVDGKAHTITVSQNRISSIQDFGPYSVPKGHYFMLGDNRDNSADSRFIGSINGKQIIGRANTVVLSSKRMDRFFVPLN